MNRTPEQVAAFRKRAKTGLAGIYTLSIPAIRRRHQNRRMSGRLVEDYAEDTPKPSVAIEKRVVMVEPNVSAQLAQLQRQVRELTYPKTQAPVRKVNGTLEDVTDKFYPGPR